MQNINVCVCVCMCMGVIQIMSAINSAFLSGTPITHNQCRQGLSKQVNMTDLHTSAYLLCTEAVYTIR